MITPQHARGLILNGLAATASETMPLADATGLVLADDIVAPGMLPAFDHAAMDGFALRSADTAPAPAHLTVVATLPAGADGRIPVGPGEAVRIMTGAMLPPGTDAVIPFEQVTEGDGTVTVPAPVDPGAHVRRAGEDVRQGRLVLKAGEELTPAKLTLLAALGRAQIAVHRRPRVAIVTTGDELVPPGQPLQPGQIHDCNTTALLTLVWEAGGIATVVGRAGDDRLQTRRLLEEASRADLVLTTGGVSMGDFDFVADVAADLGEVVFAGVAQQPGKPLTFARIGKTPLLALPGTPVAVLVTFEYYVRPVIRKLLGYTTLHRPQVAVTLADAIGLNPHRQQFIRAVVHHGPKGYVAQRVEGPGDKYLSAYAMANALLSISPGQGRLEPGDRAVALVLQPEDLMARADLRPVDNEPDPVPLSVR
jgi:molybdenum cofactor synthesis domain-containing protein